MITANVGTIDRAIRIVAGIALILAPLLGLVASATSTLGIVMIAAGAIFVGTGFIKFCPLYRLIGASTCSST